MTDEEIIEVANATETAEPGNHGYILPISFARAIIEADRAQRQAVPAIEFSDPQVQIAYAILADSNATPPAGEHWEGFAARRIVSALRQAVQEPMFWYKPNPASVRDVSFYRTQTYTEPLYTAPQPVQVPLTDGQIDALRLETGYAGGMPRFTLIAHAIEQAHGIFPS